MLMPTRYHIHTEEEIVALPAASADDRSVVEEFLAHESALLSERRYGDWAKLLSDDITYLVPRRVSRKRGRDEPEFENYMAHFDDDSKTMQMRIKRYVESTALWAEDPPSRVRYHTSGLRVRQARGGHDGALLAVYNLLVFRNRGDNAHSDLLSAQRQDLLQQTGGGLQLVSRLVLLDHAAIGAHNLSFLV